MESLTSQPPSLVIARRGRPATGCARTRRPQPETANRCRRTAGCYETIGNRNAMTASRLWHHLGIARRSLCWFLSRKLSQQVLIGSDISITVVKIDRNHVRLGITAPPGVAICARGTAHAGVAKRNRRVARRSRPPGNRCGRRDRTGLAGRSAPAAQIGGGAPPSPSSPVSKSVTPENARLASGPTAKHSRHRPIFGLMLLSSVVGYSKINATS